ncbi:hypothetical protein [Limisalsivibrio acetivorans]|uniref:hypothetical protein n=1 Tax=Limisalsivibrio acetivorans TaxID=1304888 RepID=UPI0003B62F2C|nr:hypothetical protein [Limisalsivibrio acetivorans]
MEYRKTEEEIRDYIAERADSTLFINPFETEELKEQTAVIELSKSEKDVEYTSYASELNAYMG